jgi:2-methylisocitrate lyase-like PEP mutase family enzyme
VTERHTTGPEKEMQKLTTKLRDLIRAPEILAMPGIFDGYSARLVEQAGFPAGFISGAGLSEALLGQPDVGLMGLETNVNACRALAACCTIPLLADADTGYGNAVNVYHVVRAFEQSGIAGIMLEDQTWPKRCGHMSGKAVVSAEEMVEKLRAAAESRRDPDFIIKSRTDSFATHGIDEVIRRLNLYAEAGADLLFADALLSERDIQTVARNVSKPLCVNMGFGIRSRATTPLISAARLQELGVGAVIYPRLLTACAIQGMKNGLQTLSEQLHTGTVVERPDYAVSFDELNEVVGFPEARSLEQRFVTKGADPIRH